MRVFRREKGLALRASKGFTLVELLVVLAIIGVLVGLAIAGIRIVQQINRDTQRKSFTRDIQLLLEAHQERKNQYPSGASPLVILEDGTSHGCAENEAYIATKAGGSTIEEMCSKINFGTIIPTVGTGVCDDSIFSGKEDKPGNLTICYDGQAKGYYMKVKVERSVTPYDASNVELD